MNDPAILRRHRGPLLALASSLTLALVAAKGEDRTLAKTRSVYDLATSERLLRSELARGGADLQENAKVGAVVWQARDKRVVLPIPFLRKRPAGRERPGLRRWGLRFPIALANPAALGAKTTRVTLVWSGDKDSWAEQQLCLSVNGKWRLQTARAAAAPFAGRRLSIEIPASAVRRNGRLDIAIHLAEQVPVGTRSPQVFADAVELEMLP